MQLVNDIGVYVKHMREVNQMTQKELSEASGISESTIKAIETDRMHGSIATLSRIAGVFDMEWWEFDELAIIDRRRMGGSDNVEF